ncbi:hypothetical protein BGZ65_006081 [Modicella reniformis]|uniref:Mif2/CENP-C cupin domain-containing protein n=1 Tax=Modicella reniformis TaxID=1440133 RepID=A0A9P6IX21_9FUNG|nr:hypothetical protein BGZ65_006081 [Modicella reniformis]
MNLEFNRKSAQPPVRPRNVLDSGTRERRTGIAIKPDIIKDADSLDNIDDFMDEEHNNNNNNRNHSGKRKDYRVEGSESIKRQNVTRSRTRKQPVAMVEVPINPGPEDPAGHEEGGMRRGKRIRFKPLAFWKNERLIFDRDEGHRGTPPIVKAVIRAVSPEPLQRKPNRVVGPHLRARQEAPHVSVDDPLVQSGQDSDASDSDGSTQEEDGEVHQIQQGVVNDYDTGGTITISIMEPKGYIKFLDAPGGQYRFHRGLEDDSISSGIICIPGHGRKPNQNAFFSSVIFYVVEGHVRVTIYKNSIKLGPGDRFMVPRGNQYMIENLSRKECTLFFGQNKLAVQEGATDKDFAAYAKVITSSGLGSLSASEPVSKSTAESATPRTLQTVQNSSTEQVRWSSRLTRTIKTTPPSRRTSGKGPKVDRDDGFDDDDDDLFDLSLHDDDT